MFTWQNSKKLELCKFQGVLNREVLKIRNKSSQYEIPASSEAERYQQLLSRRCSVRIKQAECYKNDDGIILCPKWCLLNSRKDTWTKVVEHKIFMCYFLSSPRYKEGTSREDQLLVYKGTET